jgi:MICOS complex subunit MIC12
MGFTTGFLGGATLTYSLLYLGLYIHRANRNVQRSLLSQQATILNSVVEPLPPLPEPPAYEVRRAGIAEELKDRWNREVEKLVRNVQQTDWTAVREDAEQKIAGAFNRLRQTETAQNVEQQAKEVASQVSDKTQEAITTSQQKAREAVRTGKEQARRAADVSQDKIIEAVGAGREKLEEVGSKAEQKVKEVVGAGKEKARELSRDAEKLAIEKAAPRRILEIA